MCNIKYEKVFKKREKEIKNIKIYTSSPFLKGYVQSFANKQKVPLKRSPRSVYATEIPLLPASHTASRNTQLTEPYNICVNSAEPYCTTQITNPM